jgi:hypothetical protein
MKLKPEHVEHMHRAILANSKAPTLPSYTARGLSEKRWRWDLLHAAGLTPWICSNVYPYANDEHIDTALRHILGASAQEPSVNGIAAAISEPCILQSAV